MIPKSQDFEALILEPAIANDICLIFSVLAAVQLDHKLISEAYEINNIRTEGNLAFELQSEQTMSTQPIPKPPLGVGHTSPQRFRVPD